MLAINLKHAAAVTAVLCALFLAAPAPAAARVTVSVEFVYGGVVGCGLGIFVYLADSWEIPLATRGLQGALVEFSAGRARVGVPLPSLSLVDEQVPRRALQVDLFRWGF